MPQGPTVEVHGVYRVRLKEGELMASLRQFHSSQRHTRTDPATVAFMDRCIPLALFDITLDNLDSRFQVGDFKQSMSSKENVDQVAYDEAVLSDDATTLLGRGQRRARGLTRGRIAFYFHYYDPSIPMDWTYGKFACPAVKAVPEDLVALVPYHEV